MRRAPSIRRRIERALASDADTPLPMERSS
jgi:hypothetical protein